VEAFLMSEPVLQLEIVLAASLEAVWECWTTEKGIQSFFAPACHIEMKPDGAYEIFFFPENPPGLRGADGQRVMAIEPFKMLSFSWNFPPGELRDERTIVVLRFRQEGSQTRLTLAQMGWGESALWTQGMEYFRQAWGEVVLARLKYRLEHGPIDWSNPPSAEKLCARV
jgi:uncharacterized protein YndB with AHSA1/START domain